MGTGQSASRLAVPDADRQSDEALIANDPVNVADNGRDARQFSYPMLGRYFPG